MGSGHIVRGGDARNVMVCAGRGPVTGGERQVTQTVRCTKKDAERVRNELLVAVGPYVGEVAEVAAYENGWRAPSEPSE